MEIVTADLDDLLMDPRNPRAHPAENVTAIKESLSQFGQVLPILVRDSDCQIVAGNGTVMAMRELGWTECKVAIYDGSDQECRALSVALNRTGELATWDESNLAAAVAELRTGGFEGMDALGFDASTLDDLAEQFGQQPNVEVEPPNGALELQINDVTNGLDQECPRCKFRFKSI